MCKEIARLEQGKPYGNEFAFDFGDIREQWNLEYERQY
jgi:hypothetical protein